VVNGLGFFAWLFHRGFSFPEVRRRRPRIEAARPEDANETKKKLRPQQKMINGNTAPNLNGYEGLRDQLTGGFMKSSRFSDSMMVQILQETGNPASREGGLDAREQIGIQEGVDERDFEGIIGDSPQLRTVLKELKIVAPTNSAVLVLGETGTGKELVARAIHNLGLRRDRPFVKVNCAAIPSGLLESELFGHERGAFTGAIQRRIGRFELAHGGTLFLDEVGDIPLELQPKLLRALQEQEFERLGSAQTTRVDVRVVAATSRDLPQMVAAAKFRSDLYYRGRR
jgi:transcriptional regulator with PAS, ATPase and Fis domain